MTPIDAKAEIFLTAFNALSRAEQNVVVAKMLHNVRLREDIIDLAIAETRNHHPSRPFKSLLKDLRKEQHN